MGPIRHYPGNGSDDRGPILGMFRRGMTKLEVAESLEVRPEYAIGILKKFRQDYRDSVRTRCDDGYTFRQLCEEFDATERSMRGTLNAMGIVPVEPDYASAVRRHDEGATPEELRREFGISGYELDIVLETWGNGNGRRRSAGEARRLPKRIRDDPGLIRVMADDGETVEDIARRLGASPESIRYAIAHMDSLLE